MLDARAAHEAGDSVEDNAAPVAARYKHPNAGLLAPLWVAEGCVGLTAIYAALNGIRLALAHQHHFTGPELHQLTGVGLRFFEGRLTLRQSVINGIRVQHWLGLVEAMSVATQRLTAVRVSVERIPVECGGDRNAVFHALDQSVQRLRVPLILLRGGIYTVISGTTAASISLFDSRGYSWISKRACGVSGDVADARHMICPSSLVALNV